MKSLYLRQISFIEDMKAIVRQSYLDKIAKYQKMLMQISSSLTRRNMSLPTFRLTET